MLDYETSRRQFLKGSGALVVSFNLPGLASVAASREAAATLGKAVSPDEIDGFLAIAEDGTVTVYTGKVDLGTGTRAALAQMAAEELYVPFAKTRLVDGDTALCPNQGGTWGSLSIMRGGQQIRLAAATARQALLDLAAERLGVPVGELETKEGEVRVKGGTERVSYGDLIGGRTFNLKVDEEVQLKDPATYTIVGRSLPRPDIPAKVTGRFTYMQDFRVPGMLHGRVVLPPAVGAELLSVDDSALREVPGIVKVVRIGNFLGIVAETEWGAIRGAQELKTTWSDWQGLPDMDRLYEHVRNTPVHENNILEEVGDADASLRSSQQKLEAMYEFAIQTHGSIGPSCAVADVKDEGITIWSPSQAPHDTRMQIAQMLGRPESDIRVIYLDGAGCYGRNGHEDATADAVLLSREVGRPVRVQWMREDEHGWDPKGPPTVIALRGALDGNGNILAWDSEFWLPVRTDTKDVIVHVPLLAAIHAATHAGIPQQPDDVFPGFVHNNAVPPYEAPNTRVVTHLLEETPLRPSWIRTPGRLQNTFANEAFMDELAVAAGVDPLEFRLRHLRDPRGRAVLEAVARRAGWEARPSPKGDADGPRATGRGIAYLQYNNAVTYVAMVAEVEVDRESGQIRVERVVVAHDCGLIINPDGVKNQIDGNVIQTVSRTLKEEVTFDRSRVTSLDWETYPILTFPEVPEVEIELIDRPDQPPWGAGEPAAAPVSAAISNAVFDAVGVRLRTVPFTPERVKAALRS